MQIKHKKNICILYKYKNEGYRDKFPGTLFQNGWFSIQIYQLLIRLTYLFKSIERINIEGEMVPSSTLLLLEYWLSLEG